MAGGQGTRLGHSGPKGTFKLGLKEDKSIFEILIDSLKKANEKQARREQYYGAESNLPHKNHPKVFIFEMEDLDNDDIIEQVDMIPTYKRSLENLRNIKRTNIPLQPEQPINSDDGRITF